MGQRVAREMHAAAQPRGVHDLGERRLDDQTGVGDYELDTAQPAKGQISQEGGPECLGFRSPNVHAQHLAPPVCIDAHRDHHGDGSDAMILPHFHIGGVDPDIGQFAFDGTLDEGVHSVYSLRHTAICIWLTLSKGKVNIYTLNKNAGTSVNQIERFYGRHLPLSAELIKNLQSFGGQQKPKVNLSGYDHAFSV